MLSTRQYLRQLKKQKEEKTLLKLFELSGLSEIEYWLMYYAFVKGRMVEKNLSNKKGIKIPVLRRVPSGVPIEAVEDIIRVANISINERTKDNKDQGLKYIDNRARSLKTIVNDVLDISKMDTYNIKMINSTYSIYNVFKEITSKYENIINDNIEFRYSISKSIPKVIYGDSVKVKQVLTTIMENAIKHTKEGFVDLQIDGIVKNNVCRLIITIEDSGSGMSLDKVNDLQGKAKNKTDEAYFMTNPEDLKNEYINHLSAVTINKEVEKITIKSKEFLMIEKENSELKSELNGIKAEILGIKKKFGA